MATAEKPVAGRYDAAAVVVEPPRSTLQRFAPLGLFALLVLLFVPSQIWGTTLGLDDNLFLWLRVAAYGGAIIVLAVPRLRSQFRGYIAAVIAAALIDAHVFGWKQSEINPPLFVEKAPYMQRILGQIVTPDVITHDQFAMEMPLSIAGVEQANPSAPAQELSQEMVPVKLDTRGQPTYITDTVTYHPSIKVVPGTVAPGQEMTISATGLRPNAGGQIFWQNAGSSASVTELGVFKTDDKGDFSVVLAAPTDKERVVNIAGFPSTMAIRQTYDVGGPQLSPTVELVFHAIIQTIFVALWATTLAILIALPLSFLASANLMSANFISKSVYMFARTVLNILRAVEALILAIVFASAVGIGPFAGMLALAVHSVASLGKLYSEAIEAIDPGPIEAISATGANRLQVIMFAVVPQFIPQFVSFTLYRWDINVRMATVIGLVGGGGIGLLLIEYTGRLAWHAAGTAILFIALVVIAMDYVSAKIRAAVV
jgi:phosphonate transport system permease protein